MSEQCDFNGCEFIGLVSEASANTSWRETPRRMKRTPRLPKAARSRKFINRQTSIHPHFFDLTSTDLSHITTHLIKLWTLIRYRFTVMDNVLSESDDAYKNDHFKSSFNQNNSWGKKTCLLTRPRKRSLLLFIHSSAYTWNTLCDFHNDDHLFKWKKI